MLCGYKVNAVGFSSMKTTPNVFSFLENPDLDGNVALFTNGAKQHRAMLW